VQRKGRRARTDPAADADRRLLIWGVNPVTEMLRRRPSLVEEVTVAAANPRIDLIRRLAAEAGVPVVEGRRQEMPEGRHQGVAARLRPPPFVEFESLIHRLTGGEELFLVALDCLQDPHNLGAVLRVAAATGVHAVLVPRHRSAPLSGTVFKVSAGTAALVDICRVPNLAVALQRLRQAGAWIYGADAAARSTLYETDFARPLCLVVGGEGRGIRPLVRKQCDELVRIPMAAGVESLNVAVSTGVFLYEIIRRG